MLDLIFALWELFWMVYASIMSCTFWISTQFYNVLPAKLLQSEMSFNFTALAISFCLSGTLEQFN